ncbi:MAG: DUF1674 domain-containing protein [Alphaproteobacteria bacterium]|nr:DUF1674 domain-containing protein [Alphaproteobacteria bacterium]
MAEPTPEAPAPGTPAPRPKPGGKVPEIGGPPGPEPTRYGDWAINGRVSDF